MDDASNGYQGRIPDWCEFERLMRAIWCRDTASPGCQAEWTRQNPALGQCAVTALIVQDIAGGELVRTVVEGFGSHYYNRLPCGREVDMTRSQFPPGTVVPPGETVGRARVLESEGAVAARTAERYQALKTRLEKLLCAIRRGC